MTCPGSEKGSRRCYWLAMGTGGALMLGIALAGTAGLRVNATASMPQGIWQVEAPGARIGRGEIVSVGLPQGPALNEAAERGCIPAGACPGGHEPLVVWLLSGHDPRSFDSRYFGGVPVTNIQGVARPIWADE